MEGATYEDRVDNIIYCQPTYFIVLLHVAFRLICYLCIIHTGELWA